MRKDEILVAAVGLEPTTYAQGQLCCPVQRKAEPSLPERHAERRDSGGGGWTRTNDLRPGTALLSRTEKSRDRRSKSDMRKDEILVAAVGLEPTTYAQGQLCCPVQRKAEPSLPERHAERRDSGGG